MNTVKIPAALKKALCALVISESISISRDTAQMSRDLYREYQKMFSDAPQHKRAQRNNHVKADIPCRKVGTQKSGKLTPKDEP